jgi:hypothetical protein
LTDAWEDRDLRGSARAERRPGPRPVRLRVNSSSPGLEFARPEAMIRLGARYLANRQPHEVNAATIRTSTLSPRAITRATARLVSARCSGPSAGCLQAMARCPAQGLMPSH